jgi:hypothetical protein
MTLLRQWLERGVTELQDELFELLAQSRGIKGSGSAEEFIRSKTIAQGGGADHVGRSELRKNSSGISPQERPAFRAVQVMNAAAHVGARAKTLASKMNLFTRQAEEVQAEILAMGSVSEAVARRSLSIGVMGCVVLLICMAGEFVIAHWTIEHFGLGPWEAYLLAAAIVLLSVEAVDLYLGALRRKYPALEADYFLIFGCIGFVLLLVLIYFLADIRAALYHTLTAISSSDSLEETISQAEAFRGKDTKEFVWLMITLTALLVIVGGAIFHDVKHRLPFSMACIRAYRRLRHTEAQMLSTAEEMAFLDAQVPQFEADFDAGLAEELQRREAQKHAPEPEVTVKERVSWSSVLGRLGPVIVSPLALALCALLLLLLWFRPASGADTSFSWTFPEAWRSRTTQARTRSLRECGGGRGLSPQPPLSWRPHQGVRHH